MTPEEQFAILRETSDEVKKAVDDAYKELIELIRSGTPPRDAVKLVMDAFQGEYASIMAAGLSVIIGEAMGSSDALNYVVGEITLSQRLYAQAEVTGTIIQGVVQNHTRGFQDARKLALELYEGYGFNPDDPLVISKANSALPKYMRDALLDNDRVKVDLARAYARAQSKALRTGALRAAYTELLAAIDDVDRVSGTKHLENKLYVAFNEKMRYYSNRIAQTELHRAYAVAQAKEIMEDTAVKYVQWRLNPRHPIDDICDYFAGVDSYGLGPGIYPKEKAPVAPAHPHCKCVLSKVFDIQDKEPVEVEDADSAYFGSLPPDLQRKVAGSERKLEAIKAGNSAWRVHNAGTAPIYQVKTVAEVN